MEKVLRENADVGDLLITKDGVVAAIHHVARESKNGPAHKLRVLRFGNLTTLTGRSLNPVPPLAHGHVALIEDGSAAYQKLSSYYLHKKKVKKEERDKLRAMEGVYWPQ
jgi:hypothetical protein